MAGGTTFWFDFASTYSYLSAARIEGLARAAGVPVNWRPFLLGPIFGAQGWRDSPFNIYPEKGAYMWRDMERLTAARGLAFHRPDPFPQNGLRAARTALAALDHDAGPAFCRAVFAAEFGAGRDISDPDVLADCLTEAGLPRDLLEAATGDAVKARLRAQTEDARTAGVFGAPSFTVDADLYWGDDRLDMALAAARDRSVT